MKIAMILEAWKPIWGGGQVVTYEISKRLSQDYGIKIDLFVMNLKGYGGPDIENINNNFRILHTGKKRGWNFKDRTLWILELINKVQKENKIEKYDLIHAHSNLPGLPGKLLSKILHIPVIYQVHGTGTEVMQEMYGHGLKSKILNSLEIFLHRKIKYDLEITVDQKFTQYKNVNNSIYIPNGVDLSKFDAYPNKKEKYFKILFVGRIHPQKGLIILINAVKELKQVLREKNVQIVVVGDGEQKESLLHQIHELKIENLFEFKGEKYGEDLIKEYKSSDIFILPSLYEGFPLTVLEAWASKIPVLTSDVGELPYIIQNDYNGWVFENKNIEDLKEKILISVDKKVMLPERGLNGYNQVLEKYDWNIIISKYFEFFNELI
jgi:glycosyltransferase involved in cell wall biosynthesis